MPVIYSADDKNLQEIRRDIMCMALTVSVAEAEVLLLCKGKSTPFITIKLTFMVLNICFKSFAFDRAMCVKTS